MFKRDWLKFGFGPQLKPFSTSLPFVIDYSGASPHPSLRSPLEIAHEVCWDIHDNYPGPFTLMVSGGVDSQAMAYAFRTAGVPVRYVGARYLAGSEEFINEHDFGTLDWYAENDIRVDFIDLDILKFHDEELREFAVRYRNNSPHLLTHAKVASMLRDGTVISSGSALSEGTLGTMTYSVFGLERYSRISGQSMVGFFLNYDPHLVYSIFERAVQLPIGDAYEYKVAVYESCGFPVKKQPKKLHGFEKLKELMDDRVIHPKEKMKYVGKPSMRPYDILYRYPLEELVKYSHLSETILPRRPNMVV